MRINPNNNIATIEGDQTHAKWIEEAGTLVHDNWLTRGLVPHVHGLKTILDLGANIGTLTEFFLQRAENVVAVEANPAAVECLRHNCPEARVVHAAVSAAPDRRVHMVHCVDNPGASFCALGGDIKTVTVDTLDVKPDFIKLDIEGWEAAALHGAERTLRECRPKILCEVNHPALVRQGSSRWELFHLLDKAGYTWTIIQPDCKYDDEQYDILAEAR